MLIARNYKRSAHTIRDSTVYFPLTMGVCGAATRGRQSVIMHISMHTGSDIAATETRTAICSCGDAERAASLLRNDNSGGSRIVGWLCNSLRKPNARLIMVHASTLARQRKITVKLRFENFFSFFLLLEMGSVLSIGFDRGLVRNLQLFR